jgi:hypothetical protein
MQSNTSGLVMKEKINADVCGDDCITGIFFLLNIYFPVFQKDGQKSIAPIKNRVFWSPVKKFWE